eukprot:6736150-Pyramimonas_sp.AAC.1
MGDIAHAQAVPEQASAIQIEEQRNDATDRLSATLQKGWGGASTTARPTTYSTSSVKEAVALPESSDEAPCSKA